MKKYISTILMVLLSLTATQAQTTIDGVCGDGVKWSFDGNTLTINLIKRGTSKPMDDYNMKNNISPWRKKGLNIKSVHVGGGVTSIGSCAFAECENLTEVIFEGTNVNAIGWGAFLNCNRLNSVSLPVSLRRIGAVAFANCRSLNSIKIPAQCRVEDQAFVSCDKLQSIDCAPTVVLGQLVFAKEEYKGGKMQHTLYSGDIIHIPPYINANNCHLYGLAKESVEKVIEGEKENYDDITSELDRNIPKTDVTRNNTYALIIGNQKYRFASDVPYAIHDARVFREYCEKTLGIPSGNIHLSENATKQMILEDELEDWLGALQNREKKQLIIYYAGHGVPDTRNSNKSYLLPTDVHGENPKRGIAMEEFYAMVGELNFAQAAIFLDACFSGASRNEDGVTPGLRGNVVIIPDETPLSKGNLVVFSAAKGDETAQGYPEQGHGLFTYYLLKELNENKGDVSFGTLSDRIIQGVSDKAPTLNMRKKQTPTTFATDKLEDGWRNFSF